MPEYAIVGKSAPRLDGREKARGEARFLADNEIPGLWLGGTVRSQVARGKILGIHKDPDFDWSRVVVVTAADLPASNHVHIVRDDYPILADKEVNYISQAVALVAAPSEKLLRRAMAAITVKIEPLTPILSIDEALAGQEVIWGNDNIIDKYELGCGDLDAGFAEADIILEGTYSTGLQEQLYLETQGMLAIPHSDGSMEVAGSIQCPYYVLRAVCEALGLPYCGVRVRSTEVGGAFGGKEDYPSILGARAAVLAKACGKPVRIMYDRSEDLLVSPKRHPSRVYHRTGIKKDGTLTAMDIDILLDAGAYTTLTMVILQRSVLHATGVYYCPNVQVRGRAIATNTPPTGAFRGFGAPQAIFAVERQMDKIAANLGMDPLDLKLANLIENGKSFAHGQVFQEGVSPRETLLQAAAASGYREKRAAYAVAAQEARLRGDKSVKGIGISAALHGSGFTGSAEDTMGTETKITYKDGFFNLHTSAVDMGQGSSTVLAQIAAECLHVPLSRVRHPRPDTWDCPNSGPTVASRSTMFIGRVLAKTCSALLEKLRLFVAEYEKCPEEKVTFENGRFHAQGRVSFYTAEAADLYETRFGVLQATESHVHKGPSAWDQEKFHGDAYKAYAWISQAIEVEVDLDTYEVTPTEAWVAAEIGKAINPTLASGQIEGGVLQGCGWSHIESLDVNGEGVYTAKHMSEYLVPTTLDAPKWHVDILETPCPEGPFGAKGLGELPANGGAPAFLAAIENATGVFGDRLPLTGERLWEEMEKLKEPCKIGEETK